MNGLVSSNVPSGNFNHSCRIIRISSHSPYQTSLFLPAPSPSPTLSLTTGPFPPAYGTGPHVSPPGAINTYSSNVNASTGKVFCSPQPCPARPWGNTNRLWETRVKKSKERQRKEEERLEKSSLEKIKQEWNFILECRKRGIPQAKYLKNGFVDTNEKILDTYRKTPQIQKRRALSDEADKERNKFIFRLSGEQWMEFPDSLKEQTYLKEWHVCNTLIQTIPAYIASFKDLTVLELSKNQINHLPVEIGCLKNLKVLNVSFNNLKSVPPELGDCENLEKLDLSGNMEITELPFELSNLKQVTVVDVSANKFHSIPICVLRMSNLQWLDISSNNLKDLPEDIDRLDNLQTLLLQKNKLTYLPRALVNMPKLSLLVVSGDDLVEIPTAVCESTTGLKFVSLKDSPVETIVCEDTEEITESEREREQFEKEFMNAYIQDLKERDSTPSYTTKVLLSLQL